MLINVNCFNGHIRFLKDIGFSRFYHFDKSPDYKMS